MPAGSRPWQEGLDVVELDAAMLQALAHPTRNRIVSSLRIEGPATSAILAQRLATNTGQTSYHLRALADVGLVVEDPERGTQRERWWKAAQRGHSWSNVRFDDDPDARHAADWLQRFYQRKYNTWINEWFDRQGEWPEAWREAAGMGDNWFNATPELLTELSDELHALLSRYRERGEQLDPDGADVESVAFFYNSFPTRDLRP